MARGNRNKFRKWLVLGLSALLGVCGSFGQASEPTIGIDGAVVHRIAPYLTGSCIEDVNHEIYGGLYSQMIFGESFQEPAQGNEAGAISGMWDAAQTGTATGRDALSADRPFVGTQSQEITFTDGSGSFGVANMGLNRWGLSFKGKRTYEVCLDARADAPVELRVALESADGTKTVAEKFVKVTGREWQKVNFVLTPSADESKGRLVITLSRKGSVTLGYVSLQPGEWGRFKGLPVRADVAAGLIEEGTTVLRYGGSMVNAEGYRWKKMTGPRDQRPPYKGTWYPYSTDGWGIIDFLNFCEAAGILGIPDLNVNESPQDMADFIEYVNGPAESPWGAKRAADGHPAPYGLKEIELGNEERVDEEYFKKFKGLAEAIWAKDAKITLVVGDFCYHDPITDPFHITGADSKITTLAAQQQILRLAKAHDREVWFDAHIWTEGPDTRFNEAINYYDAMQKIADGAKFQVAVFELNANNHELRRGLANARSILDAMLDGRFPVVTSANGLQPDGQNDNGWDQGLVFLNPSQAWLQPPGYVTRMISRSYEPCVLKCYANGLDGNLEVCATGSEDGKTVVLSVVNSGDKAETALIRMPGFIGAKPTADVEELSGRPNAVNAAGTPEQIRPTTKKWKHHFPEGGARFEFKPYSFTALKFQ